MGQQLTAMSIPVRYDTITRTFAAIYSTDVTLVGDYQFTVTAHITDHPSMLSQTEVATFSIVELDPCLAPVSLTPSIMVPQEYTITQTAVVYQFLPFTTDPPGCPVTYTFTVSPVEALPAITIDSDNLTITFFNDNDLSLVSPTEYVILVTGATGTTSVVESTAQPTLTLMIKNPCIDTNFVSITTTPLLDQTYELGTLNPTGLSWVHDAFSVDNSICGGLTYEAFTMGQQLTAMSIPVRYDTITRTFAAIYTTDITLVGDYQFTVTAHITDHPSIESQTEVATFSIVEPNPCADAISLTPSNMVPQEYTITQTAVVYQFPPFTTDPPGCPVTYTFLVSPGTATSAITIDSDNLTFTFFNDDDLTLVLSTPYGILVTGSFGTATVKTTTALPPLLLTIKNPCIDTNFVSITTTPLLDQSYELGTLNPTGLSWVHDAFSVEPSICEGLTYEAFTMGQQLTSMSFPVRYDTTTRTFAAIYTTDITLVGDYQFTVTAHLTDHPSIESQTEVATVSIVEPDPCADAISLTPSFMVPQEYTITQTAVVYQFLPFTTDPPGCPVTYTFLVSPGTATSAITIDSDNLTFTFFNDDDLTLVLSTPYAILVTGSFGTTTVKLTQALPPLLLTIKNPCIDTNFVSITTTPLLDQTYELGSLNPTGLSWVHDAFSVEPSICGGLTYLAFTMGQQMTAISVPVRYDTTTRTFASIYTTDIILVGDHLFTVTAHLTDYPTSISSQTEEATFSIVELDPCSSPVSLTPSFMAPQEYTITQTAVVYQFLPFTTDPPGCPVTYTFAVSPAMQTPAVTIDSNNLTITFFNDIDLTLVLPNAYAILVTGSIGTTAVVQTTALPPLLLMIKNPCIDTNFVNIQSVPLIDQVFTVGGQNVLEYTPDAFIIETIPFAHTLCGGLTYEATFQGNIISSISEPMGYDPIKGKFLFYTQDVIYEGQQAFTLSASMTDHSSNASNGVTAAALITIDVNDPCENPTSMTVSIMTNQEYTITDTAVEYQFPAFTTDLLGCEITYTYDVIPADANAAISFDQTSRTFTFFYDTDLSLVSATQYEVLITGTAGTITQATATALPLLLTIKNPCEDPNFVSITAAPLIDQTYNLFEQSPGFEWIHDSFSVTNNLCGELFFQATFMGNPIHSLSVPVSYVALTRTFTIYSEDTNLVGSQEFGLSAFLTNYQTITTGIQLAIIEIIDVCQNPNSLLSSQFQDQFYIITDLALQYQIAPFDVDPIRCELTYTYSIIDSAGEAAVQFDTNSLTFTFYNIDDVSLGGSGDQDYEVIVQATSGQVSQTNSFLLNLSDPCYDASFVEIQTSYPDDVEYRMDEPAISFTHPPATVVTQPFQHDLCGPLAYDPVWFGDYIDETTIPLSYDFDTNTLSFFSEDPTLFGVNDYVIEAYFENYSMGLWTDIYGYIDILESCLYPDFIEAMPQVGLDVDLYSGDVYFKMEDWLFYPEACYVTFSCVFVDGPRNDLDLCDVTNISYFDPNWGDMFFYMTDPQEWPPGDYTFDIVGTLGDLSDVYELVFTLVDPCTIADFQLLSMPFTDTNYLFGEPKIEQPWVDADLYSVDYGNNGECGIILVDFYNYDTDDYFTDESWFTFDNNNFVVLETIDVSFRGQYPVGLWVYFQDYPADTFAQSLDPFIVTIANSDCDAGIVTGSVLADQEYTIGEPGFDYEIPVFTIDLLGCNLSYEFAVTQEVGYEAMVFDPISRIFTFENLDNFSLSGSKSRTYKVTVTANSGPFAKGSASFNLNLKHPCSDPNFQPLGIRVSPDQQNPEQYLYTQDGAFIKIQPFVADPLFCPVVYECVEVIGDDPSLQCSNFNLIANKVLTFQTFDMDTYSPGEYEITIRGTTGINNQVQTEGYLTLTLTNPCPSSKLINLVDSPFEDVIYLLGDESVFQETEKANIVGLNTQVDCGPVIFMFQDVNGDDLNPELFTFSDSEDVTSEILEFIVNEQAEQSSYGEYLIHYFAYLQDYPYVETNLDEPFVVVIEDPFSNEVDFVIEEPEEPAWLSQLEDQQVQVGDRRLPYFMGEIIEQDQIQISVTVSMSKDIKQVVSFDQKSNSLLVNGYRMTEDQVGEWKISVKVFLFPEFSENESYESFFMLNILPAPESIPEKEEVDDYLVQPSFKGMVILEKQKVKKRPTPYIVNVSSRGKVTIGWSVSMIPISKPQAIPQTKVGIKSELLDSKLPKNKNRKLRNLEEASSIQEAWLSNMQQTEQIKLQLMNALEVKMESEDFDDEEENSSSQIIEWEMLDFNQDFIEIQLVFENPQDLGASQSQDFITFTFWGVEFFKDQEGVEIEFGKTLKYQIQRQVNANEAEEIQQLEDVMDGALVTVALVLLLFIGLGGRLLPTWMFLNSLQLIVHLPLLSTSMPSNLHFFLVKYLNFIRMNAESIDRYIEVLERESGLADYDLAQSEDLNYNSLLHMCGYKIAFSRNLFFVGIITAVLLALMIAMIVVDFVCRRKEGRRCSSWVSNLSLRFFYEFFFEICLCVLIHTVALQSAKETSTTLWVIALLILISIVVFIAFLVSRFFYGGPFVKDSYADGSFWKSWWGIRHLSSETQARLSTNNGQVFVQVLLTKKANQNEEDEIDTERNLLAIDEQQPLKLYESNPENDLVQALGIKKSGDTNLQSQVEKATFEGGELLAYEPKQVYDISTEARMRLALKDEVKVAPAYATLFYGLKQNHEHKVAVIHPLFFVLRRVLYSIVIIFMVGYNVIFGAMLLLLSTLAMMTFVATERQWEDKFINWQHFANEVVFYLLCLGLMFFSGVLTETKQSQAFGVILIALVVIVVILNVIFIVYDLASFIRLLFYRYGMKIKQNLRSMRKIVDKKPKKLVNQQKILKRSFSSEKSPTKKQVLPIPIPTGQEDFEWPIPQDRKQMSSLSVTRNDIKAVNQVFTGLMTPDKKEQSIVKDCMSPAKLVNDSVMFPAINNILDSGSKRSESYFNPESAQKQNSSQQMIEQSAKQEWLQSLMQDSEAQSKDYYADYDDNQAAKNPKTTQSNLDLENMEGITFKTNPDNGQTQGQNAHDQHQIPEYLRLPSDSRSKGYALPKDSTEKKKEQRKPTKAAAVTMKEKKVPKKGKWLVKPSPFVGRQAEERHDDITPNCQASAAYEGDMAGKVGVQEGNGGDYLEIVIEKDTPVSKVSPVNAYIEAGHQDYGIDNNSIGTQNQPQDMSYEGVRGIQNCSTTEDKHPYQSNNNLAVEKRRTLNDSDRSFGNDSRLQRSNSLLNAGIDALKKN